MEKRSRTGQTETPSLRRACERLKKRLGDIRLVMIRLRGGLRGKRTLRIVPVVPHRGNPFGSTSVSKESGSG